MGRQYLIPGIGYVNETGAKDYLIPGSAYINETQGGGTAYTSTLSDAVTLSDSTAKGGGKLASEALLIAESASKGASKSVAESLSVAESAAKGTDRAASEPFSIAEIISRNTGKAADESVLVEDALAKETERSLSESFSLAETFGAIRAKVLALADSLDLSDYAIVRGIGKGLTEAVSLTETIGRAIGRGLADILSLVESFVTRSGGSVPTPASRTFLAAFELRVFAVAYESRSYTA